MVSNSLKIETFFRGLLIKKSYDEKGQLLVGMAGFEPTTTTPPVWCATRLRYIPMLIKRNFGEIFNEIRF